MSQAERLMSANELLWAIGTCGRGFFFYKGACSQISLDARGRVWLWDKYTRKRIYTHYPGRWRTRSLKQTEGQTRNWTRCCAKTDESPELAAPTA